MVNCELLKLSPRKNDTDLKASDFIFKIGVADVFNMGSSDQLWLYCKTVVSGGVRKIVVDMEGLIFIDSGGIGVIINIAKFIRVLKGEIALVNVPERILNIFKPVQLGRFIKIFDSEDEVFIFFNVFV